MSVRLLGRVAAHDRFGRPLTIPGTKARALLALLAVRANHHLATDQLEDELWDGAPPRGARSTIQAHVCRLRSVLVAAGGSARLEGGAGGYELRIDSDAIDVHRFEALATQGNQMLTHNAIQAADLCSRALDEWRGPALQDVRHVPALYLEAQRLDELRLATIEARLSAELELGAHSMVVASLQRLVEEHPYRERMRGLLMVALYRSGRQVEALRAYRAGYRALADIGVQPGRELRGLEEAISREDPALNVSTPSMAQIRASDVPCPSGRDGGDDVLDRPVLFVEGPDAAGTVGSLVEAATEAGRTVLHGRAEPTDGRPYHCVVEALAPLLDASVDPGLADALAPIVAAEPPTPTSDPAVRRFQVFEAVVELLTAHAAREPLAVVLENIDQAGASTLDLIEHLARRRGDAAFSIVLARTAAQSVAAVDARLIRLERDGLMFRAVPRTAGTVIRSCPSRSQPRAVNGAELASEAFDHAARLSARAGDDALAHLGFEEAAAHYRAALTAIDFTAAPSTVRRGELQLALGRACQAAYQLDDALTAFRRAAQCASTVGDVHLLSEAAVGVATATEFGMADPETEALLLAALDALPDEEASARVELLAGLARTTPGNTSIAIHRARQAVQLGRSLDSPRPLTIALASAILVTWGPGRVRSRLADIDEVITRATDLDMTELAIEARAWRAATLDQLGRHQEAQIERAIVQRWAEHSRRPFFLALAAMMTVSEHLQHGRIGAAEAALADLPSGADSGANFSAAFAAQLFLIRRHQQRAHEFLPLLDGLVDDHTAPAAWHAARIVALTETRDPTAGDMLEAAVTQLGGIPHDWLWLSTVALLADACLDLGDSSAAAELHRQLWPYRDHTVIVAHGIGSLGPVGPRLAALRRLDPDAAASTRAHPTEAA